MKNSTSRSVSIQSLLAPDTGAVAGNSVAAVTEFQKVSSAVNAGTASAEQQRRYAELLQNMANEANAQSQKAFAAVKRAADEKAALNRVLSIPETYEVADSIATKLNRKQLSGLPRGESLPDASRFTGQDIIRLAQWIAVTKDSTQSEFAQIIRAFGSAINSIPVA